MKKYCSRLPLLQHLLMGVTRIRAVYRSTGGREHAHRLGWHVAGLIAEPRRFDEVEPGWSLATLSDQRYFRRGNLQDAGRSHATRHHL